MGLCVRTEIVTFVLSTTVCCPLFLLKYTLEIFGHFMFILNTIGLHTYKASLAASSLYAFVVSMWINTCPFACSLQTTRKYENIQWCTLVNISIWDYLSSENGKTAGHLKKFFLSYEKTNSKNFSISKYVWKNFNIWNMKNFICKYFLLLYTKIIFFLMWIFIIYLRSSQKLIIFHISK